MSGGKVFIVGAGPGDPELITVKGLQALRRAQVVVYDRLVRPLLVEQAPRAAERIPVHEGTLGEQEAVHAVLIDRARAGRVVVRLKGGDPFVFGRGGEEAQALRQAGIPFEVIPGVTSAVAVPACAGIPVTHRNLSWGFAVVTARRADGAPPPDWEALARMPTLVVLMGLKRLAHVADELLAHGADPDRPAAVISMGTTALQRTVVATLSTIAARAAEAGLGPPATLVVGEVVTVRAQLACLEERKRPVGLWVQ